MFEIYNIDRDLLQSFNNYPEALEYVLKLGDQNILAKIEEIDRTVCEDCGKINCDCDNGVQEYIDQL